MKYDYPNQTFKKTQDQAQSAGPLERRRLLHPFTPSYLMAKAAEENHDNQDIQIISYWISLNSCYAISGDVDRSAESSKPTEFFEKIIEVDKQETIYELFWTEFFGMIRVLLNNQLINCPVFKEVYN